MLRLGVAQAGRFHRLAQKASTPAAAASLASAQIPSSNFHQSRSTHGLTMKPIQLQQLSFACARHSSTLVSQIRPVQTSHVITALPITPRVISPFMPTTFTRSVTGPASSGSNTRTKERTRTEQVTHPTPTTVPRPPSMAQAPIPAQSELFTKKKEAVSGPSAAEVVIGNSGLASFLGRVYRTTGFSVVGSLGLSGLAVAAGVPLAFAFWGGLVMSLGSLMGLMFGAKPHTQKAAHDPTQLFTVNTPLRKALYGGFIAGNALTMAPLIGVAMAVNPFIVPAAALSSGLVMAGASWYAYKRPSGSLLSLAAPLTGALLGMIGIQLAGILSTMIIGPNAFAAAVYTVYPYISIALFSVFTGVDTHAAIAQYESGEADHLQHAVDFYLNFINILVSFIRIFLNHSD